MTWVPRRGAFCQSDVSIIEVNIEKPPADADADARPAAALQEFLPPAVHGAFDLLAMEFVLLPWKEAQAAALAGPSQAASQARCRNPV